MKQLILLATFLCYSAAVASAAIPAEPERIMRAYFAANERKDFDLLRAVTWPDGRHCWSKSDCKRFSALNSNFLGGSGIIYKTRLEGGVWKGAKDRFVFESIEHVRRYYNDEFSGMWSKSKHRYVVTLRKSQWRVFEATTLSQRNYGSDDAWQKRHKR